MCGRRGCRPRTWLKYRFTMGNDAAKRIARCLACTVQCVDQRGTTREIRLVLFRCPRPRRQTPRRAGGDPRSNGFRRRLHHAARGAEVVHASRSRRPGPPGLVLERRLDRSPGNDREETEGSRRPCPTAATKRQHRDRGGTGSGSACPRVHRESSGATVGRGTRSGSWSGLHDRRVSGGPPLGVTRSSGDQDRVGPSGPGVREVHRRGEHVDVPERARSVVGYRLAQAVLVVAAGTIRVDQAERSAPHRRSASG